MANISGNIILKKNVTRKCVHASLKVVVVISNFAPKLPFWQLSGKIKREQSKKIKTWYPTLFLYPQGTSIPMFKPIGPLS